jgi:hypothetical protein
VGTDHFLSPGRRITIAYTREQIDQQSGDSSQETSPQKVKAVSNSQAIQQLGDNRISRPNVNLNKANDASSFSSAAAAALESIVPGEGSSASMKLTGTIPLYKTVGPEANLRPGVVHWQLI